MANIDPLILIARSLSRMPSAVRCLPVGDALVLGELVGEVDRTSDDGVVGVGSAVGRVRVHEVRQAEQDAPQRRRRIVVVVGELAFTLAERAALGLDALRRTRRLPARRSWPTSLGQLVDPGADLVALGRQVARAGVDGDGFVELVEQRRTAATARSPPGRRRGRCAGAGRRSRTCEATARVRGRQEPLRTRARRRRT